MSSEGNSPTSNVFLEPQAETISNGSMSNGTGATVQESQPARKMSKKFTIQSVSAADDPLFNDLSKPEISFQPADGKYNGAQLNPPPEKEAFLSLEDLSGRQRTTSILSAASDQRFYSVEDLSKTAPKPEEPLNIVDRSSRAIVPRASHSDPKGPPRVKYSKFQKDSPHNKFDDSFYKRAQVAQRQDSHGEETADIQIPVPMSPPTQLDTQTTITSAYEQNMSINRLLRERHKPSLAAMGRLFGSRQKELDGRKASASSILLGQVPVVEPKKKKKCCGITPMHVGLSVTLVIIIAATVVTLLFYQPVQLKTAAQKGYVFDHHTRELTLYLPGVDDHPSLMVHLGEAATGLPFNCSVKTDPTDERCYRWNQDATVHITPVNVPQGRCINISWVAHRTDSKLMDCISLRSEQGGWFGGFYGDAAFQLGRYDLPLTGYMSGGALGSMAERMWMSTNGTGAYSGYNIPLHIKVTEDKLCLASIYGQAAGTRYLNYSVCVSSDENPQSIQKILLDQSNPSLTNSSAVARFAEPLCDECNIKVDGKVNSRLRRPYVDVTRDEFTSDANSGVWLRAPFSDAPALMQHNGTLCAVYNTSTHEYSDRLRSLLTNDSNVIIDACDIQLGDQNFLSLYRVDETENTLQPFVINHLAKLSTLSTVPVMTDVASGTQNLQNILQVSPNLDLSTAIQNIMMGSMMGYQVLNAGMIGNPNTTDDQFVRIMQFAAFMPIIQYSEHVLKLRNSSRIQNILKVRNTSLFPKIMEHIRGNTRDPLYTPIWWQRPKEASHTELSVTDQFMFNGLMIAPLVDLSSTKRKVYFPQGTWYEEHIFTQKRSEDKKIIKEAGEYNMDVPSDDILVFRYLGN